MQKKIYVFFFVIVSVMICKLATAQDSLSIADLLGSAEKLSYFKFQTSYLTNSVYNGRKDSGKLIPYLTPSIEFNHKSGLYAGISMSYQTNTSRIDLWNFDLGYNFNIGKKLSASAFINKPVFNDSSDNVKSDYKAAVGFSTTFNNSIINITNYTTLSFASKKDWSVSFGFDHSFIWGDNIQLSVTPTFTTFFSTQNFQQAIAARKTKKGNPQNQNVQIQVQQSSRFALMDFDFSLPINLDGENWGIFFTPTIALPQNPYSSVLKGPNGNIIGTRLEKIENNFFAELGVYFKLNTTKKPNISRALENL